jgi:hypothetical protein
MRRGWDVNLEIERGAARAKDLNDNIVNGISNGRIECAFGC